MGERDQVRTTGSDQPHPADRLKKLRMEVRGSRIDSRLRSCDPLSSVLDWAFDLIHLKFLLLTLSILR